MKNLEDWTTEEFEGQNILFYKGKNYIPDDIALRRRIVRSYHDNNTAGHPGELETFNARQRTLLVARNEKIYHELRSRLRQMPAIQDQPKTDETSISTDRRSEIRPILSPTVQWT